MSPNSGKISETSIKALDGRKIHSEKILQTFEKALNAKGDINSGNMSDIQINIE